MMANQITRSNLHNQQLDLITKTKSVFFCGLNSPFLQPRRGIIGLAGMANEVANSKEQAHAR